MTPSGRPPTRRRDRVKRYLGDSFVIGGMARGATHGDGSRSGDHLTARAAGIDHARHALDGDRSEGLLDRVPGWVVLLAGAILVVAAVVALR